MPDRVLLTIGTKKGLFVAQAPGSRRKFTLRGPFGRGVDVYASLIDARGKKPRIYASNCNPFFGMKILRSDDLGKTFEETKSTPAFPKEDGRALKNIWSLEPGSDEQDLWCGVEPASLFRSRDGGDSWEMVSGISNHEHARKWQPGAGGLCLHTILPDGERIHLGISTGGHYLSEDGGRTFAPANNSIIVGCWCRPLRVVIDALSGLQWRLDSWAACTMPRSHAFSGTPSELPEQRVRDPQVRSATPPSS